MAGLRNVKVSRGKDEGASYALGARRATENTQIRTRSVRANEGVALHGSWWRRPSWGNLLAELQEFAKWLASALRSRARGVMENLKERASLRQISAGSRGVSWAGVFPSSGGLLPGVRIDMQCCCFERSERIAVLSRSATYSATLLSCRPIQRAMRMVPPSEALDYDANTGRPWFPSDPPST